MFQIAEVTDERVGEQSILSDISTLSGDLFVTVQVEIRKNSNLCL